MPRSDQLAPPFILNIWKHHAAAIRETLPLMRAAGEDPEPALKTIGENTLDLYTGQLMPHRIADEVRGQVAEAIRDPERFAAYLGRQEYRSLTLSDTSRWVLRFGHHPERFVHIHPGRSAPHVLRFSANVWKTAVALYCLYPDDNPFGSLERVNEVRRELRLSPLARIGHGGLGAALAVMFEIPGEEIHA